MLPFSNRFHGYGSLKYVYKNGQAVRSRVVTLKTTSNPRRTASRVSVVVSKKVLKSAVGRNRIRRRLYEITRLELDAIVGVHDIVLMVFSSEVLNMPHRELSDIVKDAFDRAGLYRSKSA